MKNIVLAAFAAALLASTASVYAADLPIAKGAPVAPYTAPSSAYSWTGLYVGVTGGADFIANSSDVFKSDSTAGLVGGYVGYNYQINPVVLGVEGDFGGLFGSKKTVALIPGATPLTSATAQTEGSYFGDIRGRVGYAYENFLPYVAGGVAFGDQKTTYAGINPNGALVGGSFDTNRVGWTVGGGVDYAVTHNLIARVEYRYTDLGKYTNVLGNGNFDSVRNSSNEVLVGLAYKF